MLILLCLMTIPIGWRHLGYPHRQCDQQQRQFPHRRRIADNSCTSRNSSHTYSVFSSSISYWYASYTSMWIVHQGTVFEDQKKEVKVKIVAVEKEHLLRREFEALSFFTHSKFIANLLHEPSSQCLADRLTRKLLIVTSSTITWRWS